MSARPRAAARDGRRRAAALLLVLTALFATGCASQREASLPPAETAIPAPTPATGGTGPGSYVGQAENAIGVPVPVRVVIAKDTTVPPSPDATAALAYLRAAAKSLSAPAPALRYLSVEVDNTGQIDAVPLPENVDVLAESGAGANFRPAYELVREAQQQVKPDTALSRSGEALAQRLLVRDGEVRPGKLEKVPYVSGDALPDVARVVVNGSLAIRAAG